jgi:hypothetical protein
MSCADVKKKKKKKRKEKKEKEGWGGHLAQW